VARCRIASEAFRNARLCKEDELLFLSYDLPYI
jgi:hypothetical protein